MAVIIDLTDAIVQYKASVGDTMSPEALQKDIEASIVLQVMEVSEYINQTEEEEDLLEAVRHAEETFSDSLEESMNDSDRFFAELYRELMIQMAQFGALDIVYLNKVTHSGHLIVIDTEDVKSQLEEHKGDPSSNS